MWKPEILQKPEKYEAWPLLKQSSGTETHLNLEILTWYVQRIKKIAVVQLVEF